jgi:hypothetical protein
MKGGIFEPISNYFKSKKDKNIDEKTKITEDKAKLLNDIDELKNKIGSSKDYTDDKKKIEEKKQKIKTQEQKIEEKKQKIKTQEQDIESKKNEIKAKEQEIETITNTQKNIQKNDTAEIINTETIKTNNDELGKLKTDLGTFDNELGKLKTDLGIFDNELGVLKDELKKEENSFSQKFSEIIKDETKLKKSEQDLNYLTSKEIKLNIEINNTDLDILIKKTKELLIFYLKSTKPKNSKKFENMDFVDLVDLATNNNIDELKEIILETEEIILKTEEKIGIVDGSKTKNEEILQIIKYYNDNKVNSTIKKIKKILADFLASKEKENNNNITYNELINKYKSLLQLDYDELKYQVKKYDIDLKKIITAHLESKNYILPNEIEEIPDNEIDLAINAKEKRTTYESLKNALTTNKGIISGITSISKGLFSGISILFHDPNAAKASTTLPKTEVFMSTQTTDYKHPLDGTNVGQINVYKNSNSKSVDAIKSADNFLSRMQEEILNSSEKDPLKVKTAEQLFKNKDTEKRLAVFYSLNDKTNKDGSKKGGKAKRNTRKRKNAKK